MVKFEDTGIAYLINYLFQGNETYIFLPENSKQLVVSLNMFSAEKNMRFTAQILNNQVVIKNVSTLMM